MSRLIPGNQKHLTLEDRIFIENSLNVGDLTVSKSIPNAEKGKSEYTPSGSSLADREKAAATGMHKTSAYTGITAK